MSIGQLRGPYVGALLLVSLILGGGTQKGLITVYTLELLSLPLALDLAVRGSSQRSYALPVYATAGLIALCLAIQFTPMVAAAPAFLSKDPGRTLDSMAFVGFALTLFFSFGRLDHAERGRMVAWLLTGVILNVALALTQFAASRALVLELFPYALGGGFFANVNHFSSLLYVAIPFVIYQFDVIGRLPLAGLPLALIVFVEFAAGSTAGILLSIGCALVSVAVVGSVGRLTRFALPAVAVLGAVVVVVNPGNVLRVSTEDPLDRPQIAMTTLAAIEQNLPLGSGYGTFDIVYPSAEPDTAISGTFVNHAHNEVLELILEGGIPAALALVVYLGLLVWRLPVARRSPLCLAALCGIGFIAVHSLFDYPLRTGAMMAVFTLLNAIYFAADLPTQLPPRRRHSRGNKATPGPSPTGPQRLMLSQARQI